MALALDGSNSSTAESGASASLTLTTSSSNDVIVVCIESNGGVPGSVTSPNVTFTVLTSVDVFGNIPATDGFNNLSVFTGVAAAPLSSETITAHFPGVTSIYAPLVAFGISGADTSTIFDSNVSLPAVSSADADLTVNTTNANDFIFGAFRVNGEANPTPQAGWTAISIPFNGFLLVEYKIVSATQTGLAVLKPSTGTVNGAIATAIIQGTPVVPVTGPSNVYFDVIF